MTYRSEFEGYDLMWSLSDYPLDSDLFVRLSYPPFIQLGPMCIVTILWPVTLQDIPYWEIQDTYMFLTSNHYPCYYNYYDCYGAYVNFVSIGACVDFDLGMGSGTIPDSNINASSVQSVSTPAKNGRLNYTSGSSWCAGASDTNPYLQIDLQRNSALVTHGS